MIRREQLKMAIDAIYAVDRETGYGLRTLFDDARIAVPAIETATVRSESGWAVHYYFDGQRVDIPATAMVADGIATLEQSLVFKWGELREKQICGERWTAGDLGKLAGAIRQAGAAAVVAYEMRRLGNRPADLDAPLPIPACDDRGPHFCGSLANGQPAYFMPLPLNRQMLLQIAGQRFEFFNVRYILRCWSDRSLPWIYACISRHQVLGLVKLRLHGQAAAARLEIKYIARCRPQYDDTETPARGIGTFLLAGCWMLWHTFYPQVCHIFLDGEVGARRFYLSCGFREQRLCRYVLKSPQGYLPAAIADLADDRRPPARHQQERVQALIETTVKGLYGLGKNRQRHLKLAFIQRCLMSRRQPYPATTALALLLKHQARIPEAAALIDLATRTGKVRIAGESADAKTTILVVDDARFALHLENIFHLESPKRFEAFRRALSHPSVLGRWHSTPIAPATHEQLLWVHTPAYLDRLEKTAGKQLVTLDLDTQTTAHSWEVACLAVGGVFRMLDGICDGRARRGVAAVRPPGHHAEPDRAMGFCLLNNVALAARYLQNSHHMARIMIVDLDAHHGNGTQTAFYEDDSVLFVSTHRFPAYPGTGSIGEIGSGPGRGFTVNIPLGKGAGDRDFTIVVHRLIAPLARGFRPDFMLVSLGFDLYLNDRLGGMQVTPKGYGAITAMLIQAAEQVCHGRIAFVLEGGYSVKGIEECGLCFLQQLCRLDHEDAPGPDSKSRNDRKTSPVVSKVIEVQRPFWPSLA
ncbi:histone deacetylase [uncultured Desulfosarcina sp.]|uniref:histone deacetylase family protein n=1 Tax=uncultured Desulfosarcina sp. TaxID=218289 RepID=UPI0029C767B9|nr:histone deacetylase [uncultured Desulfosarcina sp.]